LRLGTDGRADILACGLREQELIPRLNGQGAAGWAKLNPLTPWNTQKSFNSRVPTLITVPDLFLAAPASRSLRC
jgi:hypothetical protein